VDNRFAFFADDIENEGMRLFHKEASGFGNEGNRILGNFLSEEVGLRLVDFLGDLFNVDARRGMNTGKSAANINETGLNIIFKSQIVGGATGLNGGIITVHAFTAAADVKTEPD